MTIEKKRGQKVWKVGVLTSSSWTLVNDECSSLNAAYKAAQEEAQKLGAPFVHEDRPRKLWHCR
jgi:hypothetical protein